MSDRVAIASIRRVESGRSRTDQDLVAVEAPLAIELRHTASSQPRRLGVFMRTPGDDRDLVLGLLYSEGVIRSLSDVSQLSVERIDGGPDTADVVLAPSIDLTAIDGRAIAATSACGLCGRLAIDSLDTLSARANGAEAGTLRTSVVAALPAELRRQQAVFEETGGLHAAGLFDADGALRAHREDVGRHNAVDKLIGAALSADWLPATDLLLVVSGRVAFEIVQKAAVAGIRTIVAVGAPSSLAVDAARAAHLTLVGFARDGRFNIYTGADRVIGS